MLLAHHTAAQQLLRRTCHGARASRALSRVAVLAMDASRASDAPLPPPQPGHRPFVLGLTGSIGMGKTTVASMFRDLGVPVLDSDAEVHRLYAPGGAAVAPIAAAFGPGVLTPEGGVDRSALGPLVAGGGAAARERLAALEGLVHPLVAAARSAFVARHAASPLVVLDVPLLYETGGQAGCDAVAVVSCGGEGVARARVLARPGASAERLDALLARQLPDAEKRARADFVVDTGCALEQTRGAVERLARSLATTAERREGAGGAEGGT